MPWGVSAPTRRLKDADAEARGQKPSDTKIGSQKISSNNKKSKQKRLGLEAKLRGPRLAKSGPELEDK